MCSPPPLCALALLLSTRARADTQRVTCYLRLSRCLQKSTAKTAKLVLQSLHESRADAPGGPRSTAPCRAFREQPECAAHALSVPWLPARRLFWRHASFEQARLGPGTPLCTGECADVIVRMCCDAPACNIVHSKLASSALHSISCLHGSARLLRRHGCFSISYTLPVVWLSM